MTHKDVTQDRSVFAMTFNPDEQLFPGIFSHYNLQNQQRLLFRMTDRGDEVPPFPGTMPSVSSSEVGGTGCATVLNVGDSVGSDRPCVVPRKPRTAFISGPLEPSSTYFQTHYAPCVLSAISAGDSFVLGPSRGIDSVALDFLLSQNVPRSCIHVYMFESEARNKNGRVDALRKMGIKVCVRGKSHTQRDVAMTKESDYDILKYLTGKECTELYGDKYRERVSGTELNERRRAAME